LVDKTKEVISLIDSFKGENDYLSNFHILQRPIVYGWMVAKTSEHLFCAFKTKSVEHRRWILDAPSAREAKQRGRTVVLRPDWKSGVDKTAMHLTLILKFSANWDLLSKLINTGNKQLVEGNWWHDNYWGNCNCVKCTHKIGLNNLGILHMQVRALFQQFG
jgi:predicted NAD-dependent protein-ADP-ribosyltransferase YbiA (DUF1768 family)